MTNGEAGWLPDPTGQHEHRYWDGTSWTDQVSDGGIVSSDAVPSLPPGAGPAPPRQGPSTGLLIGLGVLVLALVLAIVVVLATDDNGTDTATVSSEDNDDTTTTESTTTSTTEPPDEGDDLWVELIAAGMRQEVGDLITEGESLCMAQGIVDVLGMDGVTSLGLEIETGAVDSEDVFAGMTTEEREAMGTALAGCVEDEEAFVINILNDEFLTDAGHILNEDEANCLSQVYVDVVGAETLLQANFSGIDPFPDLSYDEEYEFSQGIVDCVGVDKAAQLAMEFS